MEACSVGGDGYDRDRSVGVGPNPYSFLGALACGAGGDEETVSKVATEEKMRGLPLIGPLVTGGGGLLFMDVCSTGARACCEGFLEIFGEGVS